MTPYEQGYCSVLEKLADIVISDKNTGELKARYQTIQTPEGPRLQLVEGTSVDIESPPTLDSLKRWGIGTGVGAGVGALGGALIGPALGGGRVGGGLAGGLIGLLAGGPIAERLGNK